MNWLSLLGSGPVVAIIGHIVTAGATAAVTAAVSKGVIPADSLPAIGGIILALGNVVASAGRSTNTAAAKKAVAADLQVVAKANPSAPSVWGKAAN
jgi:hypothetical protein